ncbi:hypothetical protein H4R35_004289 [Dimargaris xerosporica]|nr:hypothetical protein H4R35_004289 [Dimargaris xerosporica]
MPRSAGLDEESLLFARDARYSKLTQKKAYMSQLTADKRIRSQMPDASSLHASYVLPTITDNHSRPSSNIMVPPRPCRDSLASNRSSTDSAKSVGYPPARHSNLARGSQDGKRRPTESGVSSAALNGDHLPAKDMPTLRGSVLATTPSLHPSIFVKAMNDMFFRKFAQEEILFSDLKNQMTNRVQRNAYRTHPDILSDLLTRVGRTTRHVKLNLDAIAQWDLARLARERDVAILDRLFMINLRIMVYDPSHDILCSVPACANPLCFSVHMPMLDTQMKASAFGCCLNILLNDAVHLKLIDRDDKMSVRLTAISSAHSTAQRIRCLRVLASLLLLSKHANLSAITLKGIDRLCSLDKDSSTETLHQNMTGAYANERVRLYEVPNQWVLLDLHSLDRLKIARLAEKSLSVPFLGAIYLATPSDLGVDEAFYFSLLKYGQAHLPYWDQATTITCPMILHLFLATKERDFIEFMYQEDLPELRSLFARGKPPPGRFAPLNHILNQALAKAYGLGLMTVCQPDVAEPPAVDDMNVITRLHAFCIHMTTEIAHLLSRMIFVRERRGDESYYRPYFSDYFLLDYSSAATVSPWQEVFSYFVQFERIHARPLAMQLLTFFSVASELIHRRDAFGDLELYLELALELLTEFRKRRPDYDVIIMTRGGALLEPTSDTADPPAIPNWDRRTREEIGSEFDRLFAEATRHVVLCSDFRKAASSSPRATSTASVSSTNTIRVSGSAEPSKSTILLSPASTTSSLSSTMAANIVLTSNHQALPSVYPEEIAVSRS